LADSKHDLTWVVAPFGRLPQLQLVGQIGRGLPGKRGVGRAETLAPVAMAGRAGGQAALGISAMVEGKAARLHPSANGRRECRIVTGDGAPLFRTQLASDPAHLRMGAAAVAVGFELPLEIAAIQPRQTRGPRPIAAPVEPVTSEAGVGGASAGTAQRNQLPTLRKAVERVGLGRRASAGKSRQDQEKRVAHGAATVRGLRLFPLTALALAACKPPPDQRHFLPLASAERGQAAMERVGCGSCHIIPGLGWPRGKVGPPLDGLAEQALIAGKLPNEPDVLAAYIRNAPALVPGSAMPAMPVSEGEARDIAAYLYQEGTN